jgi:hypothetical protein
VENVNIKGGEIFSERGEKNQKFGGPQKRKKPKPKDFPSSPRPSPPCPKTN